MDCAKILGETNVQPREFPRSRSKAKDVKEKEREERLKVGNNNGQLHIGWHTQATWAKIKQKVVEAIEIMKIRLHAKSDHADHKSFVGGRWLWWVVVFNGDESLQIMLYCGVH